MEEYLDTPGEIYLERERYLLNIDELLEEMHSKNRSEITADSIRVKSGYSAGIVCCGTLVETDEAHGAEIKTGKKLLICNNNCRKFVEIATS